MLQKRRIKQHFFTTYGIKISEFFDRALFEVYRAGNFIIPDGYDKIARIANQFYLKFGNKPEGLLIFVSFFIRFIIVTVFLIDVFYFYKLDYFYKVLILLCIPLFNNLLIYILTDFAKNLDEIKSCLIIKDLGMDNETKLPITRYSPSPGNEHIELNYYIEQFIICSKVSGYLQIYNSILQYYSLRCNIIIYVLYLIGWLFIVYKNIFLL